MKKILWALVIGVFLSGLGLLMIHLGGWGPCGPASPLASAGGILSFNHVLFYGSLFGEFSTDSPVLNYLIFFLIPALDWSLVTWLALTTFNFLKRKKINNNKRKESPPSP